MKAVRDKKQETKAKARVYLVYSYIFALGTRVVLPINVVC